VDVFSTDCCVIFMSLGTNYGKIMKCTSQVEKILGRGEGNLLGKDIK
jgi:hypothetical protein